MSSGQPSRLRTTLSQRAISATTVAILGLTTVHVVVPELTPVAAAATRTIPGTNAEYNDQSPKTVPWSTTVKQNPSTRYGSLYLSLDAVDAEGVAKSGSYDNWGAPVPLNIWDSANQTDYKRIFSNLDRPDPFSKSTDIATQLGNWSYVAQSSTFTVTWNPAPGYIGYAPPLPIQISPLKPAGFPPPQYHYATTGLPAKETTPLTSTGALGAAQSAAASNGFNGVKDGMGWAGYQPQYAFQVDSGDDIASRSGAPLDYQTDDAGNYLGSVTTELTTNEGTYSIDPENGTVTFTPDPAFFTDTELTDPTVTSKPATPIRVVITNMTTNTDEGDGRVMAYGQTRPAHTINANNPSYAEVTTTYTPNVVKPKTVLKDAEGNEQAGRSVTLRPDFAQASGESAIDTKTVTLISATGDNAGRELTVPGEGTWKVDGKGAVTFTPEVGFVGNPTPIQYTAKNELGLPAGNAHLTVTYEVVDGRLATTADKQGKPQKSTDKGDSDRGLTAQKMFPGYPKQWYEQFTYGLVSPNGELVADGNALEIPNVGQYTIDDNGTVTFVPVPSFTGAAPSVGVRITNLKAANEQQLPEDGAYQPFVTPTHVYLQPAFANGNVGDTLTATPEYTALGPDIDPATVRIIAPQGLSTTNGGTTLVAPGEGTWTVSESGEFSFAPEPGFLGNPKPIEYTARSVKDADGVQVEAATTAQVTVTYNPLATREATTFGGPADTQESTDRNSPGDGGMTTEQLFPGLPTDWYGQPNSAVTFQLADASGTPKGTTLTNASGTYTIDPVTGVVSFTPADGFLGEAAEQQAETVFIQTVGTTANGRDAVLTAAYTPTVERETAALPNARDNAWRLGAAHSLTPRYGDYQINPSTVQILGPNGQPAGKMLVVPGQGTWTVDPTSGEFTFTPEPGFNGSPTPVNYTANARSGQLASGTGQVAVTYPTPSTRTASTVGAQGTPQASTDTGPNDVGLAPRDMFEGLPDAWYGQLNSPVKFQIIAPSGTPVPQNMLTIDGVGTYELDAVSGIVSFMPVPSFVGNAPQVGIRTQGLKDAAGTPAEIEGAYRPFVTPIAVELPSAHEASKKIGAPVTVKPDYGEEESIDLTTITLADGGTTLTVPHEGTWTVDEKGAFTFTPQGPEADGGAFIGNPTPIEYTAKNKQGIPAQVPGQITAFYPTPDPREAVTSDKQGVAQTSADKGRRDDGRTAEEMFPVMSEATWWPNAVFTLIDVQGEHADTVTFAGEGTYTIDTKTGVVTFVPDKSFVGKATPVGVSIKNVQGNPTSKYTAVVEKVEVRAPDAADTKNPGETLTATPKYGKDVDTASVQIVGADENSNGKTKTIPGQGTWSVDSNGAFTFTPVDGFYGTPAPVDYTVANGDGARSEPGAVSGDYKAPKTVPQTSTGDANQPQTSRSGKEMFPSLPDNWSVTYSLPGATDNALVKPEGTYTIDPQTGVVTFQPASGYRGTPEPVTVEATTATGAKESTTYRVSVTGTTTSTATTTATETRDVPTTVTVTHVPTPVETTVTPSGVTVAPTEVTTNLTVTAPPTTATVTVPPITVTPSPVTTVINGTTTVTVPPVTITPEPATVTLTATGEVPVTVTHSEQVVPVSPVTVTTTAQPVTTTVVQPGSQNEVVIDGANIKVKAKPGDSFAVNVGDPKLKKDTLFFIDFDGTPIPGTENVVRGEGTWRIITGDHGNPEIVFEPEQRADGTFFSGTTDTVYVSYETTDETTTGSPMTRRFGIEGEYPTQATPPAGSTSAAAPATTSGASNSDAKAVVDRCFGNAVRSPIAWLLPIGLLAVLGGKLIQPYMGQVQAQLDAMNQQIRSRTNRNNTNGGPGGSDQFNEIARRVDEANRQLQGLANDPNVQMIGQVAGGILAIVAAGAVLYDWCSAEPGKARTAIDSGGGRR